MKTGVWKCSDDTWGGYCDCRNIASNIRQFPVSLACFPLFSPRAHMVKRKRRNLPAPVGSNREWQSAAHRSDSRIHVAGVGHRWGQMSRQPLAFGAHKSHVPETQLLGDLLFQRPPFGTALSQPAEMTSLTSPRQQRLAGTVAGGVTITARSTAWGTSPMESMPAG